MVITNHATHTRAERQAAISIKFMERARHTDYSYSPQRKQSSELANDTRTVFWCNISEARAVGGRLLLTRHFRGCLERRRRIHDRERLHFFGLAVRFGHLPALRVPENNFRPYLIFRASRRFEGRKLSVGGSPSTRGCATQAVLHPGGHCRRNFPRCCAGTAPRPRPPPPLGPP